MSRFFEVINSDQPVLVDFYADWCGPCKTVMPLIQELAIKYKGKVKIIKVNVDNNMKAAMKYSVRGVPTFILFKKGEILWRKSGVLSKSEFEQVFDQNLN